MRIQPSQVLLLVALLLQSMTAFAQQLEIPRRHDRPPGEPITAEEAVKRMTVPEGFTVEVVAAEPDVMNPVSMFIDERGRFWITESFEYPRREPGPGRDRVKILEDTDGDGKVDKMTVFAEGLNIPSGIAVGHGGVWVVNAPDILFMQDSDGDGVADKTEVIVTGIGRDDTHELPNSLTWGPDGWLYGLNGVFNYCRITYPESNPNYRPGQDSIDFTCGIFRINPRTKEFQIFSEGTSNPWGIALTTEGEIILSACVIDHLWHMVQNGYYIRQGGPYPAYTWPSRSIVNHAHQKAAYCGIVYFDSDAYPPEYSNTLYMGNIHGACLNADVVTRSGSTFRGEPHPGFKPKAGAWDHDEYNVIRKRGDENQPLLADLLSANDAWFMPVAQKVGPDGCLYVLDWYDRYHCYQDANADPEGVERSRGRLYRIRYQDNPHAQPFDLKQKTSDELIQLLASKNVYYRETAQRLLSERGETETAQKLIEIVKDQAASRTQRLHALFAAAGIPEQALAITEAVANDPDPVFQAWGTRLALDDANFREACQNDDAVDLLSELPDSLQVALQLVIGASKLKDDADVIRLMLSYSQMPNQDEHYHQLLWRGLLPRIQSSPEEYISALAALQEKISFASPTLPRAVTVLAENSAVSASHLHHLLSLTLGSDALSQQTKIDCLNGVIFSARSGALNWDRLTQLVEELNKDSHFIPDELAREMLFLKALGGDQAARGELLANFQDAQTSIGQRLEAFNALSSMNIKESIPAIGQILSDASIPAQHRGTVIDYSSRINDNAIADALLAHFEGFEPQLRPRAIEVLTQRPAWSLALLQAIHAQKIDKSAVNQNQLVRMNSIATPEIKSLITEIFGAIRTGDRSDRLDVINQMRDFLHGTPGDPFAGAEIFKKACAQCHKIYGEGADVGPEITRSGRNDWVQLLQNVLDPSAVIGPGYQARIIATEDGRVLTGLPVEETEERLVLKIQGGKLESIPKNEIEFDRLSEQSMMPDQLEKTMTPQELADLFAYLSLDLPPEDLNAKVLPGAPASKRR